VTTNKAISIWFTGLSGSGKTTLANGLKSALEKRGIFSVVLDADEIRKGINAGLGFSLDDRKENIRRAAEFSKLFNENGINTVNAYICPTDELREMARNIIGSSSFFMVYLNTPIEVCEKRDCKGLYNRARQGDIKDFTGISAAFEIPQNPDLTLDTANKNISECIELIMNNLKLA
jgi:adenylylsulfate kinase